MLKSSEVFESGLYGLRPKPDLVYQRIIDMMRSVGADSRPPDLPLFGNVRLRLA